MTTIPPQAEHRLIEATDENGGRCFYRILKEIGEGSFARVFLAERRVDEDGESPDEERQLGRLALKLAYGNKGNELLTMEASLLRKIRESGAGRHTRSRVVQILGDGAPLRHGLGDKLIELEFLDGTTLEAWMKSEFSDEADPNLATVAQALEFGREILEALCEISQIGGGLLHRDVKPANIMVTSTGLRLFDFNVGRSIAHDKTLTKHVGTLAYMAPEILAGSAYDIRVDLYSLGVVLLELLTRTRLESNASPKAAMERVTKWRELLVPAEVQEELWEDLGRLLGKMVCLAESRFETPESALQCVETLEERLRGERASRAGPRKSGDHALDAIDLIGLVGELRAEGLLAVVSDSPDVAPLQAVIRKRVQVDDPLEDWLVERVARAVTEQKRTLVVLAGNAGDGKSHLIDRLVHKRLGSMSGSIEYIADATHADRPEQSQQEKLEEFFMPFADDPAPGRKPVSIIAMNTGMVIRFFEAAEERSASGGPELGMLFDALQIKLGLRRGSAPELPFDLVVVNLDLRDLIGKVNGMPSFFELMLDRLDPTREGTLLFEKWKDCETCPARQVCSVHFNLEAMRQPQVRQTLTSLLKRASLDPAVHLSPRLLWAWLYRMVTGGLGHFNLEMERVPACDVVRRRSGDYGWLLRNHFYEIPFVDDDLPDAPVWRALRSLDPAFSVAPKLDSLHTRFAIQSHRDDSEEEIEELGGKDGELAGLSLPVLLSDGGTLAPPERRNAAVRRRVFFHRESYEAFANAGAAPRFELVLDAYEAISAEGIRGLSAEQKERFIALSTMVSDVFLRGAGRQLGRRKFLRVSQPNPNVDTHLLVEIDSGVMKKLFNPTELVLPDAHIESHRGEPELMQALRYRPKTLILDVGGHRLVVDLALYEFLEQVGEGRQPSRRDLAQFEALIFLGEHLGNAVAAETRGGDQTLFVLEQRDGAYELYRLARDAFGSASLTPEEI